MSNRSTIDEVLEVVAQFLIRCTIMGVVVLLIWWGVLELAGDLAYSVHSRIAPMTRAQFEIMHYAGMLLTKAGVSLLFFFPFIAIRLVLSKRKKEASNRVPVTDWGDSMAST